MSIFQHSSFFVTICSFFRTLQSTPPVPLTTSRAINSRELLQFNKQQHPAPTPLGGDLPPILLSSKSKIQQTDRCCSWRRPPGGEAHTAGGWWVVYTEWKVLLCSNNYRLADKPLKAPFEGEGGVCGCVCFSSWGETMDRNTFGASEWFSVPNKKRQCGLTKMWFTSGGN